MGLAKTEDAKKLLAEMDDSDNSDNDPAPKAKAPAKVFAAKTASAVVEESDDSSDDEPAPKAKATAKATAKKASAVIEESDESSKEPTPKAKAEAKKAPKDKKEDDDDSDDDDEELVAPKAKAKAEKGKPTESKGKEKETKKDKKAATKDGPVFAVYLGGIPLSLGKNQLRKDFEECGDIGRIHVPTDDKGKSRGIAFMDFKTKAGQDAALKLNGSTDKYSGRKIKVQVKEAKPEKDVEKKKSTADSKQGGKPGKSMDDSTLQRLMTAHAANDYHALAAIARELAERAKAQGKFGGFGVLVKPIPKTGIDRPALKKDFSECGKIVNVSLPMDGERNKGFAILYFQTEESQTTALQKYRGTDYKGMNIKAFKYEKGAVEKKDNGDEPRTPAKPAKRKADEVSAAPAAKKKKGAEQEEVSAAPVAKKKKGTAQEEVSAATAAKKKKGTAQEENVVAEESVPKKAKKAAKAEAPPAESSEDE